MRQTKNWTASGIVQAEIREVLRKFQDGYIRRDVSVIDQYMDELFAAGDEIVIMGTGTGELCLNREEAKKLVESDWQYWGDLRVNIEETEIFASDDVAWFLAPAMIGYKFNHSTERNAGYLEFVEEELAVSGRSAKQALATINWVLTLTYHQREGNPRAPFWPLRLSGVLTKVDGEWRFRYMQFLHPITSAFPDERFELGPEHLAMYEKQRNKMGTYKKCAQGAEVLELLREFQRDFAGLAETVGKIKDSANLCDGSATSGDRSASSNEDNVTTNEVATSLHKPASSMVEKYFTADPYMPGVGMTWSVGSEEVAQGLLQCCQQRGEMTLALDEAVVVTEGDVAWILTPGLFNRTISEEEIYQNQVEEIRQIMEKNISPEEKLFQIHRNIGSTMKEAAYGDKFTLPFRLEVVAVREAGRWGLQTMHFAFPFYWLLEGKADAV